MRKIILLSVIIISVLSFQSCKKNKPTDITNTDIIETSFENEDVTSIQVLKLEGYTGIYFLNQGNFKNKLIVYANLKNGTKVNVTDKATFSLDTTTEGFKTLTISYLDFKCVVDPVKVVKPNIASVNLYSIENTTFYNDERLPLNKFYIKGTYEDGVERTLYLEDFNLEIKRLEDGKIIDTNEKLGKVGTYSVKITLKSNIKISSTVIINVISKVNESIKIDDLVSNFTLVDGKYFKADETTVYTSSYLDVKISGTSSLIETIDSNGNSICVNYQDIFYNSRCHLKSSNSLFIIEVKDDILLNIVMTYDGYSTPFLKKDNTNIFFDSESIDNHLYSISLTKGTYILKSNNNDTYIYGFNYALTTYND